MNWFMWLSFAVILTAIVAVVGFQPSGARPVGRTRLMTMARIALLAFVVLGAYLAMRGSAG